MPTNKEKAGVQGAKDTLQTKEKVLEESRGASNFIFDFKDPEFRAKKFVFAKQSVIIYYSSHAKAHTKITEITCCSGR